MIPRWKADWKSQVKIAIYSDKKLDFRVSYIASGRHIKKVHRNVNFKLFSTFLQGFNQSKLRANFLPDVRTKMFRVLRLYSSSKVDRDGILDILLDESLGPF